MRAQALVFKAWKTVDGLVGMGTNYVSADGHSYVHM